MLGIKDIWRFLFLWNIFLCGCFTQTKVTVGFHGILAIPTLSLQKKKKQAEIEETFLCSILVYPPLSIFSMI